MENYSTTKMELQSPQQSKAGSGTPKNAELEDDFLFQLEEIVKVLFCGTRKPTCLSLNFSAANLGPAISWVDGREIGGWVRSP